MIRFDDHNARIEAVGEAHGLSLPQAYEHAAPEMRGMVEALYQNTQQDWKDWLNLGTNQQLAQDITAYAHAKKGRFESVVILGIGGSSLGGNAMIKALCHPYWNDLTQTQRQGAPRVYFLENVDPDQIHGLFDLLAPERTLVLAITKSGSTAETMSALMRFKTWFAQSLPTEEIAEHIVAITDPGKSLLLDIAHHEGYQIFPVPPNVGGRFSVFSAVGLLPAALVGIDIASLQQGIRDLDAILQNPNIFENPAAQNALVQYLFYRKGKPLSVFMPYSSRLAAVADWYVQLWAESLGKTSEVGPTPIKAVGVTDQHSQVQLFNAGPHDKIITFVRIEAFDHTETIPTTFPETTALAYLHNKTFNQLLNAEAEGTRQSLTQNQRPNVSLWLPQLDAYHFAQLLYFLEVQTALAGSLFKINPFDQPGVELGKKYTSVYLNETSSKTAVSAS